MVTGRVTLIWELMEVFRMAAFLTCAGGDLCSAIQADTRGELLWYGLGHRIALDIARGLYFLHSHEVRRDLPCSNVHPEAHCIWLNI